MSLITASFEVAPYLVVPTEDRDTVKKLGAKYNASVKRWFVPKTLSAEPFEHWIPKIDNDLNVRARAPFFLLESFESCYSCQESAHVVTLASQGLEGSGTDKNSFYIYHYVEHVPARLSALLRQNYKTYFVDHSKTTDTCYWMNHCKCGASLGDFFMHMEPGGAFFPMDDEAVKEMKLIEIKSSGYVSFRAVAKTPAGEAIFQHAKRSQHQS